MKLTKKKFQEVVDEEVRLFFERKQSNFSSEEDFLQQAGISSMDQIHRISGFDKFLDRVLSASGIPMTHGKKRSAWRDAYDGYSFYYDSNYNQIRFIAYLDPIESNDPDVPNKDYKTALDAYIGLDNGKLDPITGATSTRLDSADRKVQHLYRKRINHRL